MVSGQFNQRKLGKMPAKKTTANALSNPQTDEKRAESIGRPDGLAMRLKQSRERKGISLSDLHKVTGLSRTAIHDYESGRSKPGARELMLLCNALNVTPNWLLCGTEEPLKRRDGLKALVRLRNSPLMTMVSMMILPAVIQMLGEDELESLLTLISSLLESRDKETYRYVSAAADVFAELLGTGSPDEMSVLSKLGQDPALIEDLQKRIKERALQL